jgi:anti-repressor protein
MNRTGEDMMGKIMPLEYEGRQIRTVMIDGEPWFVAADVCAVLEIENPSDALAGLDEDERQSLRRSEALDSNDPIFADRRIQSVSLASEAGLYSLIMRSRKPEAKQFKRHVTHEILPSIRKTGAYRRELTRLELIEMMLEAEKQRIATEQRLAVETERVDELTGHLAVIGPKAGAWQALAAAGDDWLVEDVARILNRDSAIAIGAGRLWTWLYNENVMTRYRERPQPRQSFIDRGYFRVRIVSYLDPKGGPTPKSAPQVRVTFKGIVWLHKNLGGVDPVQGLIDAASDDD